MPWEKSFDTTATLEKAMEAFWSRGYEATSMQDLVDRTGVNRGSLYATYGDKRAIFIAALRMYDEQLTGRLLAEIEGRFGPRDAIRQLFLSFVSGMAQTGVGKGCFVTNSALELAAHDPEIREIVATAQAQIEAFFGRMIRKGKAVGEVKPIVKPAEAARSLLASLIGLVVLTRSRPDRSLLLGIIDDAMRRLD